MAREARDSIINKQVHNFATFFGYDETWNRDYVIEGYGKEGRIRWTGCFLHSETSESLQCRVCWSQYSIVVDTSAPK